jgi:hypothetical protein
MRLIIELAGLPIGELAKIANLAKEPKDFGFNEKAARYYDRKTGKFVSSNTVKGVMDRYNKYGLEANLKGLTERLISGDITLDKWQVEVAKELKYAYKINLMLGRGGKNAVSYSDWGRMGAQLKFEYKRLNLFAQEIYEGKLTEKQILARIKLYANGPRSYYFVGETLAKEAAGYTLERRHTTPAEHCQSCLDYESMGWQPIGTLPPPGIGSECMHNCKCYKRYRRTI